MASGIQIYFNMKELSLILEALDALDHDHSFEHHEDEALRYIEKKILKAMARRMGANRPLKNFEGVKKG